MIEKIARGVLLSVLILGISCIAFSQIKEPISNYKAISGSMKTMEGALGKGLDDARISSAYIPGFGSIFICETVFKEDLGKLEKKAIQLVKALGPLIEVKEDENVCVIIKYGGGSGEEEQEYVIVAPKMNISEIEKWKIFSSKMKITKQPEEKKKEVKEKVSDFTTSEIQPFFDLSTPENTVKSFMEAIVLKDNEKAVECWSKELPEFFVESFVTFMVSGWQEFIEEEMQKNPEEKPMWKLTLQNPEMVKFCLEIMWSCEEEEIDENTYMST